MGRIRWLGIAAAIALMAVVPAIALANHLEKPAPGPWVPYEANESYVAQDNFTITSGGAGVSALTFAVTDESNQRKGCATGSVSVPGPLEVKYYGRKDGGPAWLVGKVVTKRDKYDSGTTKLFEDVPVKATMDGQPLKAAKLSLEFTASPYEGLKGDISGGVFEWTATCGVSLGEDISQSESAGSS
jgi:hypothetical protein